MKMAFCLAIDWHGLASASDESPEVMKCGDHREPRLAGRPSADGANEAIG